MNIDTIQKQLEERLKLQEYYAGLQSGDGSAHQIRNYHKLHSLYDEHQVDQQIEFLLGQIAGFEKTKLPSGMSVRNVFNAVMKTYDIAINAAEKGMISVTAVDHPPASEVFTAWKEATEALFRLLIDLPVSRDNQR